MSHMAYKRAQAGLVGLLVLAIVAVFMTALLYLTKHLEYKSVMGRYHSVAGDMLSVAKSWEESMNYACVVDTVPLSMSLNDLSLPKSASSKNYENLSFAYQPPPALSISVTAKLNEKGANIVSNRIRSELGSYQFGSEVAITTTDEEVVIEVRRVSETSKIIFDKVRSNSQAIQSSMWLGGSKVFDNNGC